MTDTVRRPNPPKGALSGLAAGLAASLVMNAFQAAVESWSKGGGSGEPATEKAADRLAVAATGAPVSKSDKGVAGNLVHYAFGAALGVGYGVAAEYLPRITTGFGIGYGLGVAVLADEVAVPALGLSAPPLQTPPSSHFYGLVSHGVFGLALEGSRKLVRALL